MAHLLIKDRGKGKSVGLLYTSEVTGCPIMIYKFKHILIDEGYDIIGTALNNYFGCNIKCVTFTDKLHEYEVTKYESRNN